MRRSAWLLLRFVSVVWAKTPSCGSMTGEVGLFSACEPSDTCPLLSTEHVIDFGDRELRMRQNRLESSTGSLLWDASVVLAHYVSDHLRPLMQNAKVLELGCGLGLVSTFCASLGAHVTATDRDVDVLAAALGNARRNGQELRACPYVWGEPSELDSETYNVIVASDVVYGSEVFEALDRALWTLSRPLTRVFIALNRRANTEWRDFVTLINQTFTIHEVEQRQLHETYRCDQAGITVFELSLRRSCPTSGGPSLLSSP